MKILRLIYPFLVIICVTNTVAQDTNSYYPKDYSIIPPSPDVEALLKYTEIPVNYFSGLPEINLPIYEIKEGSLTVPISFSYHG